MMVFSLLVWFLGTTANAEPIQAQVSGAHVTLENVTFRTSANGQKIVHSGTLVEPTTFTLNRQNQITLGPTEIFLFDDGSLWMAKAQVGGGFMNWKLATGEEIKLTCSQIPSINDAVIAQKNLIFYSNGELRSGCRLPFETRISLERGGEVIASPSSIIEFTSSGNLKYSSEIKMGRMKYNGQWIDLQEKSAVDLHERGLPHFFKMKAKSRLAFEDSRLGRAELIQDSEPKYTQISALGRLESGFIGTPLKLGEYVFPAGSRLAFDKPAIESVEMDGREVSVLLQQPMEIKIDQLTLLSSHLRLDSESRLVGAVNSEGFTFITPEGESIRVPKNSLIFVRGGKVARIDLKN
jgi:hypothetical protein